MTTTLTIAGSDSGGACGIQADLKTFTLLGVHGTTAITSVTAQSSQEMASVHPVEIQVVLDQVRMVLEDMAPQAAKVSMIGTGANYKPLRELLEEHNFRTLIVDPEITCYRGCPWVLDETSRGQQREIFPVTEIFAPSLAEAELILGGDIRDEEAMKDAVVALQALGPRYVVLKGGHLGGDCIDWVYDGDTLTRLEAGRVSAADYRDNGSGCTFTAAITAYRAHGYEPLEAIQKAKRFMEHALKHTVKPGAGNGTIGHMLLSPQQLNAPVS